MAFVCKIPLTDLIGPIKFRKIIYCFQRMDGGDVNASWQVFIFFYKGKPARTTGVKTVYSCIADEVMVVGENKKWPFN